MPHTRRAASAVSSRCLGIASRALHLTVADPTRPMTKKRQVPLRQMTLDLHAAGEADGKPGASVELVLPKSWRDVPSNTDGSAREPFWVLPWPSGSALAALLLDESALVKGKHCIDVGCGVAPAGLAAARAGASHVVLSDRDECALQCAMLGATANGVDAMCSAHALDWSCENEEALAPSLAGRFDVALATDLFYEDEGVSPLVRMLPKLLKPEGVLLVGLPIDSEYRRASQASHEAAETSLRKLRDEAGFVVEWMREARGAQLSGMGPEGLSAARRVVLAQLRLGSGDHTSKSCNGKTQDGKDARAGVSASASPSLASHVDDLLTRLVGK